MSCPFCDADSIKPELISLFGSQLLMSQYRCRACGAYFEGLRQDRRDQPNGDTAGVDES
jgi:transposase-like protein